MKFQRRFGNRKRTNPKRGLFLVLLLAVVLFLWFYAEKLMERIL
ncbi:MULTISPECIES: hypothetical protein [unclassified Tenacibaculum]|nr:MULTISPECIES: hypothetical protein [unclassified Tenacibaculum]